ncbi:MAG: hypothetical protein ACLTBV_21870 [Enterocloster bolteae]
MSFKWYMGSLDIGNVFKVWKYNKEFVNSILSILTRMGLSCSVGCRVLVRQSVLSSMYRNFVNCIPR